MFQQPNHRLRRVLGMKRIYATLAFTFSLLFVLSACSGSTTPAGVTTAVPETSTPVPLTKVSVTLDWFPWSNHSGLFIAQDKGYYAAEGLDVTIHPPADPASILQTVAAGRDDFGINYQTGVMIARAKGVPVVSIAAIVQHPLNSVMTLKGSGITEPKDLVGKKIGWPGIPDNEPLLDTMLKSQGSSLEEVEMVNVGFDLVAALIWKKVDAIVGAYWVHESISAINQGFPVNIMRMEQHGVPDFYELVLVTTEDKIANDPEQVQKFVRATARGYQDAIADPQAAVQLLKRVRPEVDLAIEMPGVDLLAPLWTASQGGFGWQEEARWVEFAKWMKETGQLTEDADPKAAFDNSFIAALK
ncbi:MAG: ABC transporter substrate-binding protein [Chloroflexi bacterium]|nr:ABC transporter substrate-binding protein [Chloroflexota bacterium]